MNPIQRLLIVVGFLVVVIVLVVMVSKQPVKKPTLAPTITPTFTPTVIPNDPAIAQWITYLTGTEWISDPYSSINPSGQSVLLRLSSGGTGLMLFNMGQTVLSTSLTWNILPLLQQPSNSDNAYTLVINYTDISSPLGTSSSINLPGMIQNPLLGFPINSRFGPIMLIRQGQ